LRSATRRLGWLSTGYRLIAQVLRTGTKHPGLTAEVGGVAAQQLRCLADFAGSFPHERCELQGSSREEMMGLRADGVGQRREVGGAGMVHPGTGAQIFQAVAQVPGGEAKVVGTLPRRA